MRKIPRAAVLGNPIEHSLSPKLHNFWLQRYGLDGEYSAKKVEEYALLDTVSLMVKQGFAGANVTIPHKVSVLQIADEVSDHALTIGAANTLVFNKHGRIFADNTDGYGFMSNLWQNAPQWDPKSGPAALFGAGGAARAIIVALADAGVPEIRIANRTRLKADSLRDEFGEKLRVIDWSQADQMLDGAATVVNTTSLGMTGADDFNISLDYLDQKAVVTDIVYNPLITPFLKSAKAKGCAIVDGLGMLLHQGVPGFESWFGVRPVVDDETRRAVLA